jgi:hypothetical protein
MALTGGRTKSSGFCGETPLYAPQRGACAMHERPLLDDIPAAGVFIPSPRKEASDVDHR